MCCLVLGRAVGMRDQTRAERGESFGEDDDGDSSAGDSHCLSGASCGGCLLEEPMDGGDAARGSSTLR